MENETVKNELYKMNETILRILLRDKTTGRNIIWATDAYENNGVGYTFFDEIQIGSITGFFENIIKPRVEKTKEEQKSRAQKKAEVFTPSWVCNKQNNLIDSEWFGRVNVFNVECGQSWHATKEPISFPENKTWQEYVTLNRMEISCGEAPYICSRYDTVTGERIPVEERIGLLDRKLRVISENVEEESEWMLWARLAFQSIYAYDWQGDNVLLARQNLLYTFFEYYEKKFSVPPINEYLQSIARVVSWNVWQMDGLKMVIPESCKTSCEVRTTLFGEEIVEISCPACENKPGARHTGIYCRIFDWKAKKSIEFTRLLTKGDK